MRRNVLPALTMGVALLVATPACSENVEKEASSDQPETAVVMAHGSSRFPSETAEDWVTYADAVVVGSVRNERPLAEKYRPFVAREVEIAIGELVWVSPRGEAHPAPEVLTLSALGWKGLERDQSAETQLKPIAVSGAPRLEVGHSYLIALYWQPRLCGEAARPAGYDFIASSGAIPYDESQVGVGEFEGRMVSLDEAESSAVPEDSPLYGLSDQALGWNAERVGALLDETAPGVREFEVDTDDCSFS